MTRVGNTVASGASPDYRATTTRALAPSSNLSSDRARATFSVSAIISPVLIASLIGASCRSDSIASVGPDTIASADSMRPTLVRTVLVNGLSNPWDIAFLPNGEMLITERVGRVRLRRVNGDLVTVAQPTDVVVGGEGGMLGMTIDPDFSTNRFVYTCFSSSKGSSNDNRLVRWTLSADGTSLNARTDIVTGMPWANGGRHSGCRPRFGPDAQLWVGTGDAAVGTNSQNLAVLGGKVLRVTRDGAASVGNPAIAGADARIYTYGHRNVQGIAFHPVSGAAFSVEHGPSFDDEVNKLQAGANAGWNPIPGYNESVSMTNLQLYPTAMHAVYSTGSPAKGSSGGTFITGDNWKAYKNSFAIAQLVGSRMLVLTFSPDGSVKDTIPLFSDLNTRLRVPVMGPDGALYITTDEPSGAGQIWRVAAH